MFHPWQRLSSPLIPTSFPTPPVASPMASPAAPASLYPDFEPTALRRCSVCNLSLGTV